MIYAIIEASGKQIWVQPGCFYDINKINAKPGERILLEKTLFINSKEKFILGHPYISNAYVTGKVLKHLRGRKITVFKMKPKKNIRQKNGHRQELSRILIQSIQINN
uniref:Large ribosomal subunit protein bL21m n=1 Tax=Kumanoa americana TaxID=1196377 RepID=A0A1C9CGR3_9FLOR|nr:ribosomal protein L21 [Kumanoa americana]AOM67557.1 ribosomal protein L21 [Kumanoa americana]